MPDDRRHPHQPFDPELIAGFLRGWEPVSVDLLPGKCNTNYALRFADGARFVLRLRSRGDAEREVCVMDLARKVVPVPEEVARGEGWSIYTFAEGRMLSEVPEHTGLAADVLARIASITFHASGWIQTDGSITPFDFGGGDDFTTSMLIRDDVRAWIGEDAAEAIPKIMEREAGTLAEMGAQHSLVHGDFNPTNILIHNGAVSGIVDWEFSHSGTPYMDIGNLLRHIEPSRYSDIRTGLSAGGMSVPDDWLKRAQLIDLSSHLEFLTTARSDAFKLRCAGRVWEFVAGWR
jgi:aminoglycoside phosphotransferase (APT) family kinase protein